VGVGEDDPLPDTDLLLVGVRDSVPDGERVRVGDEEALALGDIDGVPVPLSETLGVLVGDPELLDDDDKDGEGEGVEDRVPLALALELREEVGDVVSDKVGVVVADGELALVCEGVKVGEVVVVGVSVLVGLDDTVADAVTLVVTLLLGVPRVVTLMVGVPVADPELLSDTVGVVLALLVLPIMEGVGVGVGVMVTVGLVDVVAAGERVGDCEGVAVAVTDTCIRHPIESHAQARGKLKRTLGAQEPPESRHW
jgi:hypothetical protein